VVGSCLDSIASCIGLVTYTVRRSAGMVAIWGVFLDGARLIWGLGLLTSRKLM